MLFFEPNRTHIPQSRVLPSGVVEHLDIFEIRAYDVRTGARAWIFHTIPHPGEFDYETWPPEAWKTAGGNNAWAGMSLDTERGIVFASTGSPAGSF